LVLEELIKEGLVYFVADYVSGEDHAREAFAETFEVVAGEVAKEIVFFCH